MGVDLLLGGQLDSIGLGAHNDGGQGSLVTKLVQGELAPIMLRSAKIVSLSYGTAAAAATTDTTDLAELPVPGGYNMTCPAAAIGSAGWPIATRTTLNAMGRRFGLWVRGDASGTTPGQFDVFVDRRLMWSGDTLNRGAYGTALSGLDAIKQIPIADDLPDDGPHQIDICLWPDTAAATSLFLFALLVEKRFAAPPTPSRGLTLNVVGAALTTAASQIGAGNHQLLRKMRYVSTDTTAAHTVSILWNSTTIAQVALAQATATAPGFGEFDFGDVVAINPSHLTHKIDATVGAGSVTYYSYSGN